MDRNSVIGLLLIGGILLTFSLFNSPSDEEVKAKQAQVEMDSLTKVAKNAEIVATTEAVIETPKNNFVPKLDENGEIVTDSANEPIYEDTITGEIKAVPLGAHESEGNTPEEVFVLENDKLKLEFTSKGGHLKNAFIKDYKSYQTYIDEDDDYLQLLDSTSNYKIDLDVNGKIVSTIDYVFSSSSSDGSSLTLSSKIDGKSVDFVYSLVDGSYDLSYLIKFNGFTNSNASQTKLVADFKLKSTEKYLLTEHRNSTFYYDDEGSYDYMGVMGDDELEIESKSHWVAFKQLFFSAVIMNDNGFASGSKLNMSNRDETDSTYLKNFDASLGLGLSSMDETVSLKWYFGPNDYDVLALHENGSEDVVDLGWGIFRWVNVYFFRPVFNMFMDWGIGAGLAILLLTFFVKLVLSPVNYKMYKSSATMRVLKPEISGISEKFPKKEDAMKKQQALMALYKDAGASPLAGCVPMLIQMPVLIAIFRLFPSSIELRQKAFLWAEDLSTYDQVASWTGDIPLLTSFYGNHVSLFTLLMAITTLLYTHFNSSNMQQPTQEGMPNMKYIMYFFPFMMIFWFNTYSSGLSFYYFISTLMTMGIMFAIKRFFIDEDKILAKIQENKASPKKKKGKSKFAQRLEDAQRLQQERVKTKK